VVQLATSCAFSLGRASTTCDPVVGTLSDMPANDTEPLERFRKQLYAALIRWGDALFELSDALLCTTGPVHSVPSLSLEPEFSRSHGSLYRSLAEGSVDDEALRELLVAHLPRH
jgi:hypothetical protein